ncbi:hypothetical protein BDN70DRAFT_622115 [Pholiota conissans]|uniref:Protein kinase domain-containing protein n=1 Tax=Pholiota conissans TaxID=109636 RepID=A0A9P5Z364_9AGAR|nr:hypothetical protein BDN70DRAFT_622115 [Pholiota conissans]
MLRPRFRPGWVPSWITHPPSRPTGAWSREDWIDSTNRPVVLKKVLRPGRNPDDEEEQIAVLLASPPLSQDPRNHCVVIYDVLSLPDDDDYNLIGIQFLHHNHIAHRDCTGLNVMMDGSEMYPKGFHPREPDYNPTFTGSAQQKYTRTQRPPKYYWIDFGLSARLDPADEHPLLPILRGNDKSVPEHQDPDYQTQFADPYATDIYHLGNLIREYFTEGDPEFDMSKKFGLDFMKLLVDDMVQNDPTKRPTIDERVPPIPRRQRPFGYDVPTSV